MKSNLKPLTNSRVTRKTFKCIEDAKEKTAHFDRLTLTIALNYSSQNEIVDAVKNIVKDAKKDSLDIEQLDYLSWLHTCIRKTFPIKI